MHSRRHASGRAIRIGALSAACLLAGLAPDAAAVELMAVGNPVWRPAGFHLFSAPANPGSTFQAVSDSLFEAIDGHSSSGYVPHDPPYESELSDAADSLGYANRSVFAPEDIDHQPNAVYLAYMLVADPGVTGSSIDFASGPMIPAALFPIDLDIDVWRDGVLVDHLLGADESLDLAGVEQAFDGRSHSGVVHAVWYPWDDDPLAGITGSYEIRQSFRDVQGDGGDTVVAFTVVPEPSASASALMGALGILAFARRRAPVPR